MGGSGTQIDALSFGGTGGTAITEKYNGTAWSSGGSLMTARYRLGGNGTGSTDTFSFGGTNGTTITEVYW